jgi:hypothetical protein
MSRALPHAFEPPEQQGPALRAWGSDSGGAPLLEREERRAGALAAPSSAGCSPRQPFSSGGALAAWVPGIAAAGATAADGALGRRPALSRAASATEAPRHAGGVGGERRSGAW